MAQIVFDIPDAVISRVLNAVCAQGQYDPGNPEHGTKAQFTKATIASMVKGIVIQHESMLAGRAAADAARQTAVADITIT